MSRKSIFFALIIFIAFGGLLIVSIQTEIPKSLWKTQKQQEDFMQNIQTTKDEALSTQQEEPKNLFTGSNPTSTPTTNMKDSREKSGITPEEYSQILPLHPSKIEVESITGRIMLRWLGTGEDVKHYKVYRKTTAEDWQQLGYVQPMGDNTGWYEFIDSNTKLGITYFYGVTAINNYDKQSLISKSTTITQQ